MAQGENTGEVERFRITGTETGFGYSEKSGIRFRHGVVRNVRVGVRYEVDAILSTFVDRIRYSGFERWSVETEGTVP